MKRIEISDLIKVESSNINAVGYNEGTTYVQFKNGSIYSYPETSKEEFEMLAHAKSVGGRFAQSYRQKEDYNKLEDVVLSKKEELKLVNPMDVYATVNSDGALMVEGIEKWITNLVPINDEEEGTAVRMVDPETEAVFEIRRTK